MPTFHVRTVKLKIFVTDEDRKASWKRIRQISDDAWKAANLIASGQYFNDQLVRTIYARRKVNPKQDQLAVDMIEEEFKGFFGTKRQATTERDIRRALPDLPSCVTNPLNQVVVASYQKEKGEVLSGRRSLRTYRKGMPIPTKKRVVLFGRDEEDRHTVTWKLGRQESMGFGIIYGRDKANNRHTVDRIISGDLDYSAPQIQLKDRDLYLLLPVKDPQQDIELDAERSVGVDLGIAFPAYVAVSDGPPRRALGSSGDFLKVRMQMQNRHRRLQRKLKSVKGGRGRLHKMKALERIKQKEANFVRSYNHFISREVVDFALHHRAGVIKMEMLEGFGREESQAFVLRNWSYFELQTFIDYKAKRHGITVVKVDPYHTSQTCSQCGHYEEGQRDAQEFQCKSCGEKLHADYNAALNIARSDKIVKKKEDCEYYKQSRSNDPDSPTEASSNSAT